ncbi:putative Glyoxylate/succinic semialdehyde reductase 2, chloroplastic [Nannochloris sp. 'desiccata']|nr:putative Glyoxylate/succinic semialdehyde reductase 2, chloroplastic [Chlorella desiccata (nom. nud.)]
MRQICNSMKPMARTILGANSQKYLVSQVRSGQRTSPNAVNKTISPLQSLPTARSRPLSSPRQRGKYLTITSAMRAAEPADTRIGFVGLGIMGYAMAFNLLNAGYSLTVWNRSPGKCDDLAAGGAAVANSPADVVKNSDIIFAMLSDREACLEVALGQDGIAGVMTEGKGYVDVSTVDAATAIKVATAVRSNGGLYLEAPVSGSKGPAEQGQLIFLTGGDEELFSASAPLLDVMGKASFFLGEVGAGARMKLVANMVMGSMMAALAEGLTLAESSGLDKKDVVDVLNLGAMACPMFALKGAAMVEGKYMTPAFPLKHQQKDLKYALELAQEVGLQVPTAVAANGEFEKAMVKGLGDADFSAVLEAVMAGKR